MSDLTVQQQLTLERYNELLKMSIGFAGQLDTKANTLLQAGGIITGLAGAVAIPAFAFNPTSLIQIFLISTAFLAFLAMIICAMKAWMPSKFSLPGSSDWQVIKDSYLEQDIHTSYENTLVDVLDSFIESEKRNSSKARWVMISAWLLAFQVVGILTTAILVATKVMPWLDNPTP